MLPGDWLPSGNGVGFLRFFGCHFNNSTIVVLSIHTKTDVVRTLAALAEVRLRVFRALVVAGPAGLTPGDLAARLEVAPNTLSFHLKELSHAGLISQERQGRNLIYAPRSTP